MKFLQTILEVAERPAAEFGLVTFVLVVSLVQGAVVYWSSEGKEREIEPMVSRMGNCRRLLSGLGYIASFAVIVFSVLNLGVLQTVAAVLVAVVLIAIYPGKQPVAHWMPIMSYLDVSKLVIVGFILDW